MSRLNNTTSLAQFKFHQIISLFIRRWFHFVNEKWFTFKINAITYYANKIYVYRQWLHKLKRKRQTGWSVLHDFIKVFWKETNTILKYNSHRSIIGGGGSGGGGGRRSTRKEFNRAEHEYLLLKSVLICVGYWLFCMIYGQHRDDQPAERHYTTYVNKEVIRNKFVLE